ncbi:Retrovirus-related Pol poly from transposon [Paramuricea clavata]|uniref:Retrovirus-related Pol poly from transposon, partial n=1 Tax=Paramuricea clavata TaxID=317549 RepID=A0A7D9I472_PARCT|nr:Retrovirus-related Pol poly from transposon [Paramuricea clavata]
MAEIKQACYDGTEDVDLWLMKMKFDFSTKNFEGKQEAHAIASKLEGAAFLCFARLDDELQDDPKEVKAALRKEFDKESIDHEKAVDELRAIDNAMSRKIKSDSKHRDLNLTQLSEELDRLELIYKTTAPKVNLEVNNFKTTGEADEISLRKIIREEIAAALSKENDGSRETEDETKRTVGFVGKRNFPPKPRSGKTGGWEQSSAKINSFSAAKKFNTLTGTVVQSGSREFKHEFICDSGAEVSVIPTALAQEHYMKIQPTTRHVEMANGTHAECRAVSDPIVCHPRRHNLVLTQKINEPVGNHVKSGHLTPSKSPWAFPIVPVLKPDKTDRLYVDYRPLNKITQNDPYPTGNLQEVLDNLSGANYFGVIDLAQGYLQVPLAKEDRPKTVFRSPTGFWESTRMQYGLKGSSANFSRLMQRVLGHIPPHRLALYMDDICIISKTFEEHLVNLQGVFDALRQHVLRVKAKKCAFAMKEVKFLGHKVCNKGVQPEEQKVKAIRAWVAPTCLKEVQMFLGAVGWYRKFIKDFSTIARPLTWLLEKDVTFTWGKEQDDAFNTLRHELVKAPVLAHPDPTRPFVVTITSGAQVVTRTNLKPLLKILEQKDPSGRRATLMRDIAKFEPRMEADALSRIGWNVKWEERGEDTSKVVTIGGSQDEIGPCKDVRYYIPNPDTQGLVFSRNKPQESVKGNEITATPTNGMYCTAWFNHGRSPSPTTGKNEYEYAVQVDAEPVGGSSKLLLVPGNSYSVIMKADTAHL